MNNEKIKKYVNMFNTVLNNINETILLNIENNIVIQSYVGTIKNIIRDSPDELIFIFIKNIYSNQEYKQNILSGDDKFFINNSYENVTNDDNMIKLFKSCWIILSDESKIYIKNAMKTLINISSKYIEMQCEMAK